MKYPAAPPTPFLAALPQKTRVPFRSQLLPSRTAQALSVRTTIACSLLKSLASLFASPVLCFQWLAASFHKTPGGVGYCAPLRHLRVLRVSALSFAVLESALVFKNLQVAPSTPGICISRVFMHLQTAFYATRVFSQTSALPPSFSLFSPLATRLPRAELRGHSPLPSHAIVSLNP
jgi:hypothetical protein